MASNEAIGRARKGALDSAGESPPACCLAASAMPPRALAGGPDCAPAIYLNPIEDSPSARCSPTGAIVLARSPRIRKTNKMRAHLPEWAAFTGVLTARAVKTS